MEFTMTVNSIYDLERYLWSGGLDTFNEIWTAGKLDQLEGVINEIFCDRTPSITEINDLLWFDDDLVKEMLGLNKESKEWCIDEEEYQQLKENGVLSDAHLEVIQESFDLGYPTVTYTEFNDVEELSDEEIEELDKVVA